MVRWTRDPTGLPLGIFVATLTVTAAGATGSPAEIKDTLVVAQALMLSVSPQARADTTMEGATIVSSDSTAVTLIGLGSSTAVWSATHTSAPWLTLTTSGGTSSGMARWTRDPSGLSAGTLVDTIAVTTTGASPDTVTVTLVVVPPVSVTNAVNHILVGSVLSALQEAFLDSNGNSDGTYNVGDVLAWLDRCNSATPEGCVASEAEIEQARAVLDGLQQGAAADSQLMREGRLK